VSVNAVAFAVGPNLLVTTADAVQGAGSITVQAADGVPVEAQVIATDADSGLALLQASGSDFVYLDVADSFAGGAVKCVSFPTVAIFDPEPEAIGGTILIPKGQTNWTAKLNRSPRMGGGPLLAGAKVVGVELATRDTEPAQTPVATLDELKKLLGDKLPRGGGRSDAMAATLQLTATR
jgi:hypothetical protein